MAAAPPHRRARALAPLQARRALRCGVGLDSTAHAAYEGEQAGAEGVAPHLELLYVSTQPRLPAEGRARVAAGLEATAEQAPQRLHRAQQGAPCGAAVRAEVLHVVECATRLE